MALVMAWEHMAIGGRETENDVKRQRQLTSRSTHATISGYCDECMPRSIHITTPFTIEQTMQERPIEQTKKTLNAFPMQFSKVIH